MFCCLFLFFYISRCVKTNKKNHNTVQQESVIPHPGAEICVKSLKCLCGFLFFFVFFVPPRRCDEKHGGGIVGLPPDPFGVLDRRSGTKGRRKPETPQSATLRLRAGRAEEWPPFSVRPAVSGAGGPPRRAPHRSTQRHAGDAGLIMDTHAHARTHARMHTHTGLRWLSTYTHTHTGQC